VFFVNLCEKRRRRRRVFVSSSRRSTRPQAAVGTITA
jgi:hypothetical protein